MYQSILEERDSETLRSAENILNKFLVCACESSLLDLRLKSNEEIRIVLRKFYCGVRKQDGSLNEKSSMIFLRFGLQKSFMKSYDINIENNEELSWANVAFFGFSCENKKGGNR